MPDYLEGPWRDVPYGIGIDSHLIHGNTTSFNQFQNNILEIYLGYIVVPQPEPVFKQHTVTVELIKGGLITNVAWPGPNVEVNAGGIPSSGAIGIHGIHESPMPGQLVAVAFIEGDGGNPIIVQKYPYSYSQRPDLEAAHFLPMTNKQHGPTDVVLGHHIGSYIALRGTIPLPGQIDIKAMSTFSVDAALNIEMSAIATYEVNAANVDINAIGTINLNATPSVIVNSGVRAVAANGDLTTTMLGPMPILATGNVLKVV